MYLVIAILILALVAWLAARTSTRDVPAAEIEVIDGDTVAIDGRRMRLKGVDAPEWRQDGGREAAGYLRRALRGAGRVTVRSRGRDRYARPLVILIAEDGTDLNFRLVLHGYAVAYSRYSRKYAGAQRLAMNGRRGVWADPDAMWPEQYRHGGRRRS